MADPPKASTQRGTAAAGQPATLRVSGEPSLQAPAPDATRRLSPDATGLYEADSGDPAMNSPRMLSLNQAGWALVGWLTTPPDFVTPIARLPDQAQGQEAVRFALLLADLDPSRKTGRGFSFVYRDVTSIEHTDPNVVLDPFAPWDRTQPNLDTSLRSGFISFTTIADPFSTDWNEAVPRLSASVVFIRSDGSELPAMTFIMHDPRARVSERAIDVQDQSVKNFLLANHRRPIPHSFFDTSRASGQRWKDARALFEDNNPNGPLATLIVDYDGKKDDKDTVRAIPRDKIGDLLEARLGAWKGSAYQQFLNRLLARQAMTNSLSVGSPSNATTKSYSEWLAGIAANEALQQQNAGNTAGTAPNLNIYPREFDWVLGGASVFRYQITFEAIPVGATILGHKVGTSLPEQQGIGLKRGVSAALGAVQMTVTPSSAPATSDGKIPEDSKFVTSKNISKFFAVLFELKAGLGNPPKFPTSISLLSGTQLTAEQFEGAFFEIFALDVSATAKAQLDNPVMTMGAHVTSGKSTFLLRFYVGGQLLEGTFEDGSIEPKFDWDKPKAKMPDFDAIKRIASARGIAKDTDFAKPKVGPSVSAGVSLGCGRVVHTVDAKTWIKPPPRAGSAVKNGGDGRTVTAFFERDKADIAKAEVNGWTRRFLLETILATDLALLDGAPAVDIDGFASPEGTPEHNRLLSLRRAFVVRQAILDAVVISPDLVGADGQGDTMARTPAAQGGGGLSAANPTGSQEELAKFEAAHKEEVAHWPEWRKVEIDIRGRFFFMVVTVSQDESP